ncbi:MAG: pantoate--beta-alanine ligase, partial [Phycisphaerae bacterium]|nr:pantoate--beta-alanine ligase [Phycisphaerae bacterium]
PVQLIHDPAELDCAHGCAFVPTMGALHEGHASLLRRARATGRPVCVSIFVNPTQFAPSEDLDRYPRTLDADLTLAEAERVAFAFVPASSTVYPEGIAAANVAAASVSLPPVATQPRLEDLCRPGHLAGVQLVVSRLFDLVRPAVAVFGEKDWQQLALVQAFVAHARTADPDRWPGLAILPHATVREHDGLALSSRNRYLPDELRLQALGIPKALQIAHSAQRPSTAERLMRETLEAHGFEIEYAVVRDSETLLPVEDFGSPTRALIAARLSWPAGAGGVAGGSVRLIDNAPMTVWR